MGRFSLVAFGLLALILEGCNSKATPTDAGVDKRKIWTDGIFIVPEFGPDLVASTPDAGPLCDPSAISKFCKVSTDCDAKKGMQCLHTSSADSTGICTCKCTPDDPKTPKIEDNCPEADTGKNKCVAVTLSSGATVGYCMRNCKPKIGNNDCPDKIACEPASAANWDLSQPVCAYTGCTSAADCPVSTATVCSVATQDCPTGERCVGILSGQDEGRCVRPGKCDATSGLCDVHELGKATAGVGDPCQSDLDCAGNMKCAAEIDESKYYKKWGVSCTKDSECCSRKCESSSQTCSKAVCTVLRRHGYCVIPNCEWADTLTIRACPAGSACNLRYNGGYCQKACDMTKPEDCRGVAGELIGDYECRRWGNIPGYMKTDVPVCDFGTGLRCSFFASSSFKCAILGADTANSTNMKCRGLDNKDAPGGDYDPTGFCLDDTSSGTATRDPLPVP